MPTKPDSETPDKQVAVETLEGIARKIVTEWADVYQVTEVGPATLARLGTAILAALRNERERCWREVTAKADEWRRQARQPGTKRNTLNQMAHGAAMAANVLREGKKNE